MMSSKIPYNYITSQINYSVSIYDISLLSLEISLL